MSDAERGFGLIGPPMGPAALGLAAQILADEDPETLRTARADPRMVRANAEFARQMAQQKALAEEEKETAEDLETAADRRRRAADVRVSPRGSSDADPPPPQYNPPLLTRQYYDDEDEDMGADGRYSRPTSDTAPRLEQTFDHRRYTKPNSPKAGSTRQQRTPAGCWIDCKRLVEKEKNAECFTHVCVYTEKKARDSENCYRLLKMTYNEDKVTWLTTVGNDHMKKFRPESPVAKSMNKRSDEREADRQGAMGAVGDADETREVPGKKAKLHAFVNAGILSDETRALATVTRWFVYGNERVSFRTVVNEFFREMTAAFWGSRRAACPYMTAEQLYKWIDAEFEIMLRYIKLWAKEMVHTSSGNKCVQLLHDAGTLKDHLKREAIGVSGVRSGWGCIETIAVGFLPIADGYDATAAHRLCDVSHDRLGFRLHSTCASMVADRAAMHVAGRLLQEEEPCDMHDTAKVVESMLGLLVRSKNKVILSAPEECVDLLKRARAMVVFFSYGSRLEDLLHKVGENIPGGVLEDLQPPHVRFKPDTCATRAILSKTHELHSIFRLVNALKISGAMGASKCILSEGDWEDLVQVESVMRVIHPVMLLVQSEAAYLGAVAAAAVSRAGYVLSRGVFEVVDLAAVLPAHGTTKVPFLRETVSVDDFGAIGRETCRRSLVEFQRQFCGSDSEDVVTGAEFRMTDRQAMASVLDIRTMRSPDIPKGEKKRGFDLLRLAYIHFAGRKKEYDTWLAATEAAEAAAELAEVKKFDAVDHLIHLDIGPIYKRMEQDPKFGLLGIMARAAHAAGYAGAADLASDLLDKKNDGVIKKNDVFKDVSGNMNPAGRVIVARLKTHLEVVYSGDAGKTRMPTGFFELLIKAEVKAQLPPPPPPPGAL
ncbi:hypothetical protein M885DRAFT_591152 [Pelagophyceae sp. CCMP2097]|nr:hypothetical protein M885DRAFT_591152 [Pelagophyceae sp. CCMP2097]